MISKSISGNSTEEIEKALQKSLSEGFKPTLAIAFISIKQNRKAICELLREEGIDVLGATSCGEFIDGHQSEGAAAILLMDMHPDHFTILFEAVMGRSVKDASRELAKKAQEKFKRPAFILCTTGLSRKAEMLDGEMVVRSIEEVAESQVNMFGGMAGDDWSFTGTYIFTHEKETDTGIAALVIDEDHIIVRGMAISGWKPLGISRIVTSSEGTTIFTIDDQPALDMYLKYLGETYDDSKGKYEFFEDVAVHYPFLVERESGTSMMVTPMSVDKSEKALICDVAVKQGSKLRFTMPPDFDFVEEILEKANDLKNSTHADAEALLIFSCASRVSALGPLANHENEGLADVWNTPMAGFYTYGEYGRAMNERQEFHSTTNSWVTLKEK